MLDIVKLSQDLSQEDFSDFLHYLKQINEKGVIKEWSSHWESIISEGANPMSAMHHVYYDLLIDPQTGDWKKDLEFSNLTTL